MSGKTGNAMKEKRAELIIVGVLIAGIAALFIIKPASVPQVPAEDVGKQQPVETPTDKQNNRLD